MKAGASKAKGNAFERLVSKTLGEVLFDDKEAFLRSPGSGALATIRKYTGGASTDVDISGDIMQVKYLDQYVFPYSIECKHWKEFKMEDLLLESSKSTAWKAWAQCCRDAARVGRYPMLIFRANHKGIFVCQDEGNRNATDSERWSHVTLTEKQILTHQLLISPLSVVLDHEKGFAEQAMDEVNRRTGGLI